MSNLITEKKEQKAKLVIYWCRRDFRLTDNPALQESLNYYQKLKQDSQVSFLPIFILDSKILQQNSLQQNLIDSKQSQLEHPQIGYPRRLFLSRVLANFCLKFPEFIIFQGQALSVFTKLLSKFHLYLFFNEDIEPFAINRDSQIREFLTQNQAKVFTYKDQVTINLQTKTQEGNIYTVFTPFQKAVWQEFLSSKVYPKVDLTNLNFSLTDLAINSLNSLFSDNFKQEDKNLSIKVIFSKSLASNNEEERVDCSKESLFTNLQARLFNLLNTKWTLSLEAKSQYPQEKINSFDSQTQDLQEKTNSINLDDIFKRQDYLEWPFEEELVLDDFEQFLQSNLLTYKDRRDDLGLDVLPNFRNGQGQTSKLSVALKWGLVSARTLKQKILDKYNLEIESNPNIKHFLVELIWREFYKYLLYHKPNLLTEEFQIRFRQVSLSYLDLESLLKQFSPEQIKAVYNKYTKK